MDIWVSFASADNLLTDISPMLLSIRCTSVSFPFPTRASVTNKRKTFPLFHWTSSTKAFRSGKWSIGPTATQVESSRGEMSAFPHPHPNRPHSFPPDGTSQDWCAPGTLEEDEENWKNWSDHQLLRGNRQCKMWYYTFAGKLECAWCVPEKLPRNHWNSSEVFLWAFLHAPGGDILPVVIMRINEQISPSFHRFIGNYL